MRKILITNILFLFLLNKNVAQSCITLTEPPIYNAGIATNRKVCQQNSGLTIIDLTSILMGEDSGGTWSVASGSANPGLAFSAGAGTFNPNNLPYGVYLFKYLVGTNNCNDSEEVRVLVEVCCPKQTCVPISVRKL